MRLGLACLDTWPAVTRVLSRSRESTLGTRLVDSSRNSLVAFVEYLVHVSSLELMRMEAF